MINLSKGGRVNLSKDENGNTLSQLFFGVNWGAIKTGGFLGFGSSKKAVDLDASVVLLDENKQDVETIYFGNKHSIDGSVHHSGDDLTGDVDGDDEMDNETISVNLNKVNNKIHYIAFILNSYSHQTFDEIPYMRMRIYTTADNRPVSSPRDTPNILAKYNLENDSNDPETTFQNREGIVLGYAYRKNGEWKFKALGNTGTWTSISMIKRALPNLI